MQLTAAQVQEYHEKGFLIIDGLFSPEEIQDLRNGVEKIGDKQMPNIIREDNGAIRSVFAPHELREEFDRLYQQERLVTPAQQLMGDPNIYLYQYKLNNKKAFDGGIWEWHQDFAFWHIDDGVERPDMLSAMVLLQDTDHPQGPLMFIPGSHKKGIVDFHDKEHLAGKEVDLLNSLNADLKYTVDHKRIKELVDLKGIVTGTGQAGTCIFFHANLFHASNANLSPYNRNTAIITYNKSSNAPPDRKEKNRPEYVCSRKFEPIIATTAQLTVE